MEAVKSRFLHAAFNFAAANHLYFYKKYIFYPFINYFFFVAAYNIHFCGIMFLLLSALSYFSLVCSISLTFSIDFLSSSISILSLWRFSTSTVSTFNAFHFFHFCIPLICHELRITSSQRLFTLCLSWYFYLYYCWWNALMSYTFLFVSASFFCVCDSLALLCLFFRCWLVTTY